jgi:uncharacterized repeat protein (TIGR03833 family)
MHYLYYKRKTFATCRRLLPILFIAIITTLPVYYLQEKKLMDGTNRSDMAPGMKVAIVLKKDQRAGILTEGVIKDILTKSPKHTHGIKVRLESGEIGRVKKILSRI